MTDDRKQKENQQEEQRPSRLFSMLFFVVILLVIAGGVTLFFRHRKDEALKKETERMAIPTVAVFHPSVEPGQEDLVLPSTMQAYVESPIFARTSGYLKKWYHDIGSHVKKGDLLADIDSPEVDQQLDQAKSQLNTSQANENLSRLTADRYQGLLKTDSVAKQDVDNAVNNYAAMKATTQSSESNVKRLQELTSFEHVYAPFAGVITRRNTDVGYLINAGNGGTVQELFDMAQSDPIRAYVSVPEAYSPAIHKGLGAYLELTQYAGQKFHGQVVRTADAIDQTSRTLNTEVDVPNKDGLLLPGGYAQVHLLTKVSGQRLQVPVNALLFRAEGLRVVVVDQDHKIHLQAVTIGRDYGTSLEVLSGLAVSDFIVLNPSDSLDEGMQVNVTKVPQNAVPQPHPLDNSGAKQ